MKKFIYFIPAFILMYSCHAPESEKVANAGFPDLGVLLQKSKDNTALNTRYSKNIFFGEEALDTIVDFKVVAQDLSLFYENALDKPSYIGKYKVHQQPKKVYWKAVDPNMLIQLWQVDTLENGNVNHHWEISQVNDLFEQARSMELMLSSDFQVLNYRIEGFKKLKFGDSVKYYVETKMIKGN